MSLISTLAVACLTVGFIPTEGLRWSESQHSVSPMPRARGGDRDGTVAGASGILPNPNTSLNPSPVWSRQRELLMHLLPWYTAAAAAAQTQPGNRAPHPCPICHRKHRPIAPGYDIPCTYFVSLGCISAFLNGKEKLDPSMLLKIFCLS